VVAHAHALVLSAPALAAHVVYGVEQAVISPAMVIALQVAATAGVGAVGVEEQAANVAFWASIARFKEAPSVASATHT